MRKGNDQYPKLKSLAHLGILLIGIILCSGGLWGGCENAVGDPCIADSQCGLSKTCDLQSFEGYCTIPDCEEETCPNGSLCVEFKNAQRFCMATCTQNDECRDGYTCIILEESQSNESIGYCGQ